MKKIGLIVSVALLAGDLSIAQNITNAFSKDGKIIVQYSNGNSKQVVSEGVDTILGFSGTKNFVLFQRLVQKSKNAGKEGELVSDQFSICRFDLNSGKETILFTTCLDGIGGTVPGYANSNVYPNINLCGIESPALTADGEKLFFQTYGWSTCPAIHFYDLKQNTLLFYRAGWLEKVSPEGIQVMITGLELNEKNGVVESNGRYYQTCLFDMNGSLIKELSPKEY